MQGFDLLSVRQQVVDGGDEGVGLREDRGFELRVVADPGIEGADAADAGVELIEEFVGDADCDFGSVAPGQCVIEGRNQLLRRPQEGDSGLPRHGART